MSGYNCETVLVHLNDWLSWKHFNCSNVSFNIVKVEHKLQLTTT